MEVKFDLQTNLVPAIVQDANTKTVLMLGYMNREALNKTIEIKKVTFYSRSKKRLWTKGETSKNYLQLVDIKSDCDKDTLLIKALPLGPTCHTGNDTCWDEKNRNDYGFLSKLEDTIQDRWGNPTDKSYTSSLFAKGINKIAQKVGEEAVELIIEAKDNNDDAFLDEAADLLYHFMVLLKAKEFKFDDVINVLVKRHFK